MVSIDINRPRPAFAQPLYGQVRELILAQIERGDWSVGHALPNELQLATEFGVSVGTVRRAIGGLEAEGIVVRKQGRGTFVARKRLDSVMSRLLLFRLPDGGLPAITYNIQSVVRRLPTAAEAVPLGISRRVSILHVEQTINSRDRPIGIERVLVSADNIADVEAQLTTKNDLYTIYNNRGLHISHVTDTVSASLMPNTQTKAPGLGENTLFLQIDRKVFGPSRQPIEWRTSWISAMHVQYSNKVI